MRSNPIYTPTNYANATQQEISQLGREALNLARATGLPASEMLPTNFYTNALNQFGTEYAFSAGRQGPYQDLDAVMLSFPCNTINDLSMMMGIPPHFFPPPPFEMSYQNSQYNQGGSLRDLISNEINGNGLIYMSIIASRPNKSMSVALILRDFLNKVRDEGKSVFSILSPDSYRLFTTFVRRYAESGEIDGDTILDIPIPMPMSREVFNCILISAR